MEIKEKLVLNECYWFRNDIVASLKRDLIGPYFEDEEIMNEDPVGYYISGILYPRDMGNPAPEEDKEGECSTGSDDDEEELSIGFANKVCPSSMGISFAIDLSKGEEFQVTIESAYYLLKKMGSPTGGRMMYKAEVPIERISKILGHRDVKTTIEYLGLNIDDMSEDLEQYAQYMQDPVEPETVQNINDQIKSGQSGISVRETYWLRPKSL